MRSPVPPADAHGHLQINLRFPYQTEPQEMIGLMESLNIEFVAVTTPLACWNDSRLGNEQVDQVLRQHGRRFRGYVTVNRHVPAEAIAEVERWRMPALEPGRHACECAHGCDRRRRKRSDLAS